MAVDFSAPQRESRKACIRAFAIFRLIQEESTFSARRLGCPEVALAQSMRSTANSKIRPEFEAGLMDIEGFSHLIVVWMLHCSNEAELCGKVTSDDLPHCVLATRSPRRPSPHRAVRPTRAVPQFSISSLICRAFPRKNCVGDWLAEVEERETKQIEPFNNHGQPVVNAQSSTNGGEINGIQLPDIHLPTEAAMDRDNPKITDALHDLNERAKELRCLYHVNELLNRTELSLAQILRGIVEVLPRAWQFPEQCQARIVFEDRSFESYGYRPSRWAQTANIIVQGENLGSIEVSYREVVPAAHKDPFLFEERKLIDTVAEQIAGEVRQRRLGNSLRSPRCNDGSASPDGVLVSFSSNQQPDQQNAMSCAKARPHALRRMWALFSG